MPAGEPVLLRVSYGEKIYGYFYGDGFRPDNATPVAAAAGQTRDGIDLDVPAPAYFSGRLLDRSGQPVAGKVYPTTNTVGMMESNVPEPIDVDATGAYSVVLPASYADGVWYEDGIQATDASGNYDSWLGGGSGTDPNFYFRPVRGDVETGQDITLPDRVGPVGRPLRNPVLVGEAAAGHPVADHPRQDAQGSHPGHHVGSLQPPALQHSLPVAAQRTPDPRRPRLGLPPAQGRRTQAHPCPGDGDTQRDHGPRDVGPDRHHQAALNQRGAGTTGGWCAAL